MINEVFFILCLFLCFFFKIYFIDMWIVVSVYFECFIVKKVDYFFFCYDDIGCLYYNILVFKDFFMLLYNKVGI